jgi:peptidoglycan-associated lipoprotein
VKPNIVVLLSLTALVGGCASKPEAPVATGGQVAPDESTLQSSRETGENPSQADIAISEDILTACGIGQADAYFSFDSARVDPRAREILGKVSECFSSGPLAKRSMRLVGHADPRGDEEYNLLLGGRRADAVRRVFVDLGLADSRISTTSRGEMDAIGTDTPTWARDRRVDVLLGA